MCPPSRNSSIPVPADPSMCPDQVRKNMAVQSVSADRNVAGAWIDTLPVTAC